MVQTIGILSEEQASFLLVRVCGSDSEGGVGNCGESRAQ